MFQKQSKINFVFDGRKNVRTYIIISYLVATLLNTVPKDIFIGGSELTFLKRKPRS